MRRLFIYSTLLFWLALLVIWQVGRLDDAPQVISVVPSPAPALYTLAEVAHHASPEDCWMAIDGQVYALSNYLPEHPARTGIIEDWCGKEASEAYRTKLRRRAHSSLADKLLTQYWIGMLVQP